MLTMLANKIALTKGFAVIRKFRENWKVINKKLLLLLIKF